MAAQRQIRMLGEEALGRQVGADLAGVEIDHPGGQALGLAEVVRAHDERHSVGGESGQHSLDLLLRRRVEIGGRLVEEQHVGPDRPGAGQGQPLLLAARQGARRPLGAVGQAGALQRLARPAGPLRLGHAGQPEGDAQVVDAPRGAA